MGNLVRGLLREPLHPPTTHFPMALYPMAVVFDVLAVIRQDGSIYTNAAFVVMLAASAMAGIAMVTGFLHFIRDVSPNSKAWRVAILHMSVQLTAVSILLVSLALRVGHVSAAQPPTSAMLLAIGGTLLMLFGGWLGGRLVFFHAVSVQTRDIDTRQPAAEDD